MSLIPTNYSPLEILSFICKNNWIEIFTNTFVVFRILLTLPVTVASAKQSFFKLMLIKNYLRSSISQERLVGFAMISVEHDILNRIDCE